MSLLAQQPAKKSAFFFTPQDADMLRHFVRYHFLRPLHVHKLTGRNIISVRRRLRQLHEEGFLQRLSLPTAYEQQFIEPGPGASRLQGPDQAVYFFAPRGVKTVQQLGFADDALRANTEKSPRALPHDLQVSAFHLALELAVKNTPNLALVHWEQRRALLQDSITPDALFALRNNTKPSENNTAYFFLEVELSRQSEYKNGESGFVQKMRNYTDYAYGNRSPRHLNVPEGAEFRFRVITVTPTMERSLNLCEKLREADFRTKRFWFTQRSAYSLDQPEAVLQKIFFTPKDFTTGNLYSIAE